MFRVGEKNYSVDESFYIQAKKGFDQLMRRADIGFIRLSQDSEVFEKCQNFSHELRENFTDLVVVGIGGSSLGARAIDDIFHNPKEAHQLHFIDNVDPYEFQRVLSSIQNLEKAAWLIVSKSGSTIESLTSLDFIILELKRNNLDFKKHLVVVSELRPNPLSDFARTHSLPLFEIPETVGGRFSVLTPVGLIPWGFLGISLESVRQGALLAVNSKDTIESLAAQSLASFDRQEWITGFWFYGSCFRNFGFWLQQLWAESLAKKFDRERNNAKRVSTPLCLVGACDQHSVLQQIAEGWKDKWIVFFKVKGLNEFGEALSDGQFLQQHQMLGKKMGELLAIEAKATSAALTQLRVSNLFCEILDLSPGSIGFQFMLWQMVVGVIGESLNIDTFNQPGVELGKRLAKEMLLSQQFVRP